MKKSSLKLIPIGLILIFILSACGTTGPLTVSPNPDIEKLEAEIKEKDLKIVELETKIAEQKEIIKELEANKDTDQTTSKPTGEMLSVDEAEDLLSGWYDWDEISYMPDMDKEEDGSKLYGFLLDYSDSETQWSGETSCYAWVNSSTEVIHFEEAGYTEESGPNLYANIPDTTFPTPMRDGVVIAYEEFSPPDNVWGVAYTYEDKTVMDSYQAQLEEAGFVDLGTVQSVESLWQYQANDEGAIFTVEMYSEGETFAMNMYIND